MIELTITVPGNPTRALSPNASRKMHWSHKSKDRGQMFSDAKNAALGAIGSGRSEPVFTGDVRVSVVIAWGYGRKRMDQDNAIACLKSLFDGLTAAKVWSDDRVVILDGIRQTRDPEKRGYMEITISQASEEQAA